MSVTNKSIVFLGLAFLFSWSIAIGGDLAGLSQSPQTATLVLVGMMAGPALAAVICAFAFEKERRVEALGLRFKPNIWWLFAWLIGLACAAVSVVATLLLSDRTYVDIGTAVRALAEAQGQDMSAAPPFVTSTIFIVGAAAIFGALVNTVITTFTEELGWRGYLHHLWRPSGFWRASLATGFIWGLWHAPAIYLYGLNYPEAPVIGIAIFTAFCTLFAPLYTLVRDRGGSTWAAGIFHGTTNALGGLTILAISNPTLPWNGIAGIGGFVALLLGCALILLLQRKAPAA